MKKLKFTTVAGFTYEIEFSEDTFFEYMKHCGVANIHKFNQIALFINNIHSNYFDVPFDSVLPQTIEYQHSRTFRKRYNFINDKLKYNI